MCAMRGSEANHTQALSAAMLLIEHGADPSAKDIDRCCPLLVAAQNGHTELVELLLRHGARRDTTGRFGHTPLHVAAKCGHVATVEYLVDELIDVTHTFTTSLDEDATGALTRTTCEVPARDARDDLLHTPLHLAALSGHARSVVALLRARADLRARDADEKTPLHLAAENGHPLATAELIVAEAESWLFPDAPTGATDGREQTVNSRLQGLRELLDESPTAVRPVLIASGLLGAGSHGWHAPGLWCGSVRTLKESLWTLRMSSSTAERKKVEAVRALIRVLHCSFWATAAVSGDAYDVNAADDQPLPQLLVGQLGSAIDVLWMGIVVSQQAHAAAGDLRAIDRLSAADLDECAEAAQLLIIALLDMLHESDRTAVLQAQSTIQALDAAGASRCDFLLSSPALQLHLMREFYGEWLSMLAATWPYASLRDRSVLLVELLKLSSISLVMLPAIALFPPLEDHLRTRLVSEVGGRTLETLLTTSPLVRLVLQSLSDALLAYLVSGRSLDSDELPAVHWRLLLLLVWLISRLELSLSGLRRAASHGHFWSHLSNVRYPDSARSAPRYPTAFSTALSQRQQPLRYQVACLASHRRRI